MREPEPRTENAGVLDDWATVERLDPQGLLRRIESFPEQCAAAWRQAGAFGDPSPKRTLPPRM